MSCSRCEPDLEKDDRKDRGERIPEILINSIYEIYEIGIRKAVSV